MNALIGAGIGLLVAAGIGVGSIIILWVDEHYGELAGVFAALAVALAIGGAIIGASK